MRSRRPPVVGMMTILVHNNGRVYVRYGQGYDSLDPDHKENKWVKSIASRLEKDVKKFISSHQEVST